VTHNPPLCAQVRQKPEWRCGRSGAVAAAARDGSSGAAGRGGAVAAAGARSGPEHTSARRDNRACCLLRLSVVMIDAHSVCIQKLKNWNSV
jgi:hypothetical protein